ncbi:hypothetical protein [Qipengyuania huizhouensis]|uniref:hypothetical protein n=1 Tax=Qipengyuania huizhouensis TaxID=2867245 RepID=UPI001C88B758|nr:hypothetical protein [Qipengyuania huizhouensis]MBX7461854.1 hypothetical protein [Qipengyuania huizhouensis]
MKSELGFQKWEAMGHFFSEGDYLGFNKSDYRGAIAEYEKAWLLLSTPWQQQTGGSDILEGIADFALRSRDPELASKTLDSLLPRAHEIADASLREACDNLADLARQQEQD